VRAAAARMSCQNNLKQLGLAALNFESGRNVLPPGYLGPIPNETAANNADIQWMTVIGYLLPYIEQDNIYRLIQTNWDIKTLGSAANGTGNWWNNTLNWNLAHAQIRPLICPAHDPYEWTQGVAVAGHFFNDNNPPFLGPGHYYAPTFPRTTP